MLVRVLGFAFEMDGAINLERGFDCLTKSSGQTSSFGDKQRILHFARNVEGVYHAGAIVTIKDHKKYLEYLAKPEGFEISVHRASEGAQLMDLNFFVVNSKTGIGAYMHYHQSFSVNQFGLFVGSMVRQLSRDLEELEVQKIDTKKYSKTKLKKVQSAARRKVRGRLICRVLVRQEKLKDLLEELAHVSKLEYNIISIQASGRTYSPLPGVKRVRERVVFDAKASVNQVKESILGLFNKGKLEDGAVKGYDLNGNFKTVQLMNQPDVFDEFEFDEVAEKLVFDPQRPISAEECWPIEFLLSECKKRPELFEAK